MVVTHLIRRLAPATLILCLATAVSYAAAPAVQNPGFEQELKGWHTPPAAAGLSVAALTETPHGEKTCLRLAGEEGKNPWAVQGLGPVRPLAKYSLAAFARHGAGSGRAALKLEFYDYDNKYLAGYYAVQPAEASGEWAELKVEGEAPEKSAKVALLLRLLGPGSADFDDVTFTQILPPPALVLTTPRLVVTSPPGTPLTLGLRKTGPDRPGGTPTATLNAQGWKEPQALAVTEQAGTAEYDFGLQFKLPALPAGVFTVTLQWEELAPLSAQLVVMPPTVAPATGEAPAQFLREGQPFFPLALYHVAPEDFPRVAEAGFTVAQIAPPKSPEHLAAALAQARERTLPLLVPLSASAASPEAAASAEAYVTRFQQDPQIFGWLLADEPELQPEQYQALPELYVRLRRLDPAHPFFLACGPNAKLADWAPLCDALLVQFFPRPGELAGAVQARMAQAAQALGRKPWLAVLPAGWSGRPATSPELARSLGYCALAAGARGVAWFCLREQSFDLTSSDLWAALPADNRNLTELARAFREGQPWREVTVGVEGVRAVTIKDGDTAWVILINDTPHALQGGVKLPAGVTKAAYLEDGEEVKVRDRSFRFSLGPGAARALQATLAPAGGPPPPTPTPTPEG